MHKHSEKTLAGLNIIVTGGSSGIGHAMAEALIHAQADVAIISRRSPEQWEHTLPTGWRRDHWIVGDFNQPELLVKNTEKWVAEHWSGKVDGIIHSAVSYGFGSRHTFLEIVPEEWQEIVNVGAYGPFLLTKALLPQLLRQPKGLILHVSSEVAFNAGPGRIGYSATKSAARAMFTGLAQELQGSSVSVVGVLPEGMVDTPGIRRRRPADFDYSDYATADTFAKVTLLLVETFGSAYHGEFLVVDAMGNYRRLIGEDIASQSR